MTERNERINAHMSGHKGLHIASNWPVGQRASHDIEYSVELAILYVMRTKGASLESQINGRTTRA